ncbi:DUF2007 domain-containing protein [Acinetobacter shaoyimingii]|uniref:DUF2007 domain-containing protein n=1 Tax=Acinetobacter shaoyimingii TaxID=2715164 RepID=A0A6G8RRF7_9GAMM|nr:DUF2007 domain-containing protein [Acinetobacter shaoyimingii]QIO04484.1 DUF2007 domain-containing protein [Acinetobacter shaoyimingii]
MSWRVVATYSFPYEAQIAKARLDSVGIPSQIENEHTINMNWMYSNALGGVRIAVPLSYIDDAIFLLESDFSQDLKEQLQFTDPLCPKCQSLNIEPYTEGKRAAFLVFTLLGFPLYHYKHGYLCQNCGHFFTYCDDV